MSSEGYNANDGPNGVDSSAQVMSSDAAGEFEGGPRGSRKRRRRGSKRGRRWKPFSEMSWEEKQELEEREEQQVRRMEEHAPKLPKDSRGRVKRGVRVIDYRPDAPRNTTQFIMEEEAEQEEEPAASGDPLASFDGESFDAHGGAADLEPTPLPSPERPMPAVRQPGATDGFPVVSLNGIALQHVSRWDLTPADMAVRGGAATQPASAAAAATAAVASSSIGSGVGKGGEEWAELMALSKEALVAMVMDLRGRLQAEAVGGGRPAAAGSPGCGPPNGGGSVRSERAPPGGSV
eukprot:CAMPEP_0196769710 /NCGR_PEP_ID=MMETSP1104-20130614/710_1 /TAXON_ID=33652 /ORGANISM="Cafeteria sp., Strain Caron Lab Isolate" /LENGTH=291 /DNA_ID=CAMNT_0042139811 /DNA_START=47 /DNA_END=922 /DNA_ORIENTATION=-